MSKENSSINQLFDSAFKLHQKGNFKEAEKLLKKNLELFPKHLPSIFLLGTLSAQNKEFETAKKLLQQAIKLKPDFIEGHNNLGNVFQELDEYQDAITCYQSAIKLNPKYAEAHYNLGKVYKELDNNREAISCYENAIKFDHNSIESHNNLGNIFMESGKYQDAVTCYQSAIKLNPNYTESHNNLGNAFKELGKYQDAITCYQSAIKLNPKYAEAHYNLGTAFQELEEYYKSISHYKNAIKLNPYNAKFYYNLALAEIELGQYYSAIDNYKKALSISNDYASAKHNLARLNLSTENFSEGWRDYEMRHDSDKVPQRVKNISNLKRWDGKPFDGTLFVHGEQGIGDLIIHSSMIADLYKIQPDICLTVDKRILGLFQRSFKEIDILDYDSNLDYTDNDYHIPLASLGSFLRQSINNFPKQPKAYLVPDPEKVNHFKNILNKNKKLKVGLSWSTIGVRSAKRTISLNQMAKFLTLPNIEFINLQYGDTSEEREKFKLDFGIELTNFDGLDLMNDFEGLVALMASCDLVITITNTTSHFSGAIGSKTWVIVPIYTSWDWFHERNNSLWYPNVKLFRQKQHGQWEDIINKLYCEIKNIDIDKTSL